MVRFTRRSAVKLAGAALVPPVVGATASARSGVETVVELPGERRVPENFAIDEDGTLYFGTTAGEIWRLTADQTRQTGLTVDDIARVATLPGTANGVEVAPGGSLYAASLADAGTGLWEIPGDGGDPSLFATISPPNRERAFPNGVLYDDTHRRLLVTESLGGRVYEVPFDATDPDTAASVWLDADALDTAGPRSFGANGLAMAGDGAVFVAVTEATSDAGEVAGRLVRAPVADDGSAKRATTYVEGPAIFGADGLTTRSGNVYVAANSLYEVVRVTPDGRTATVASIDDGLVFPSDVAFGTVEQQRNDLFICNFANERNPTEGAILRTTVGRR